MVGDQEKWTKVQVQSDKVAIKRESVLTLPSGLWIASLVSASCSNMYFSESQQEKVVHLPTEIQVLSDVRQMVELSWDVVSEDLKKVFDNEWFDDGFVCSAGLSPGQYVLDDRGRLLGGGSRGCKSSTANNALTLKPNFFLCHYFHFCGSLVSFWRCLILIDWFIQYRCNWVSFIRWQKNNIEVWPFENNFKTKLRTHESQNLEVMWLTITFNKTWESFAPSKNDCHATFVSDGLVLRPLRCDRSFRNLMSLVSLLW